MSSYLVLSEMPRADAFTVTAAGDLLRDFAILSRPRFSFAMVLSVFRSSFDHNTRVAFFFFAITAPLQEPMFYEPRLIRSRNIDCRHWSSWIRSISTVVRCSHDHEKNSKYDDGTHGQTPHETYLTLNDLGHCELAHQFQWIATFMTPMLHMCWRTVD